MQKTLHFTYFDKKNTHFSGRKIVHKYTIAIVTVHICTVSVALAFYILVIFFLSLSQVTLTLPFSHLIKSSSHLIKNLNTLLYVQQSFVLAARSVYIVFFGKTRDTQMRKGSKGSYSVGKLERLWLTKNLAFLNITIALES